VQSSVACICFLAASSQIQAQALVANSSINSNPSSKSAWHDTLPSKLISARVDDGVLTIDGMIAKMQLNYDIDKASYMYFFVPGVGTAVVSLSPMSDSIKVKNVFDGSTLSFTFDGHSIELTSKGDILGSGKSDAYIHFDGSTVAIARTPRMGFGKTLQSPYVWPVSSMSADEKQSHLVDPPALPANMTQAPAPVDKPTKSAAAAPVKKTTPATATASVNQPAPPQAGQQQ
jgi:hypothetical protein